MRRVSQSKDRSVPGMGRNFSSTRAMVTDSTASVAVGAEDRVRGVDGHAQAGQLVPVDLVAAALGQDLDQADDGDARPAGRDSRR